jgi:sortase A
MLSIKLKRKKIAYYASFLCLLVALSSFVQGGYLLLKANLAQYLLNEAWQETMADDLAMQSNRAPWPWADIYPVAKLSFERFDITQIVLNNDSGQALAFGPGLTLNNANEIGDFGSSVLVISAHNDTHFSILNELKLNDNIKLTLKSGKTQVFNVDKMVIIDTKTEQLALINYDEQYDHIYADKPMIKELVLVTCYPFDGVNNETTLRYIVYLS